MSTNVNLPKITATNDQADLTYAPDIRYEYDQWLENHKQWAMEHAKMKDKPPSEGRDYLKHARRLLPLLEGIAEVNSIAKGVILSFKAVVMYEQNRQENDARVSTVFLAQTDMMGVLLNVDKFSVRHQGASDIDSWKPGVIREDLLYHIHKEIRSCANSIDTYYKESRFVKFWKAQDWKDRMLEHINAFNKYGLQLQQALSIRTASGVDNLVSKMDQLLTRLFIPQTDWEKKLVTQTRELGDPREWIGDTDILQMLARTAHDPVLRMSSSIITQEQMSRDDPGGFRAATVVEKMKTDLRLSLDSLCDKNIDVFVWKLDLQTQSLQDAITTSAREVVRTLSGPHDRLLHAQFQQLWKEAKWHFAVSKRSLANPLFELYFDLFSRGSDNPTVFALPYSYIVHGEQWEGASRACNSTRATISRLRSSTSSIAPSDLWTMEKIALYGLHLSQSNDCGQVETVQINETKAFSDFIPLGWTLPQWGAYAAVGWLYEARVYRKRIRNMIFKMHEMQALVLPPNRHYVYNACSLSGTYYGFLSFEPLDQGPLATTHEVRDLVKDKILSQDTTFRERLASLHWNLEDESTIHFLFSGKSIETFILLLVTLVLEHELDLCQASCKHILDQREWERVVLNREAIMEGVVRKRYLELEAQFSEGIKVLKDDLKTYHGGIWSFLDHLFYYPCFLEPTPFTSLTANDVVDHYSDLSLLENYPLQLSEDSLPSLQCQTWEAYLTTLDPLEIPPSIPKSWSPLPSAEERLQEFPERSVQGAFPNHSQTVLCDRCDINPIVDQERFCCLKCHDFDLCEKCYDSPPSDHVIREHNFDHPMVRLCMSIPFGPQEFYFEIAKYQLEILQNATLNAQVDSQTLQDIGICGHCHQTIFPDTTFYKCFGHECRRKLPYCASDCL
ncbi:hypothetical protein B0H34DRAFT_721867 [Crassisporium funariophilum]|nr:hypothetical protein B0H34DRAFT_721867 [Crassisporium funariophilum]